MSYFNHYHPLNNENADIYTKTKLENIKINQKCIVAHQPVNHEIIYVVNYQI